MSGQCYACGTEFGLFKKEHGCKNCGFAFCSNCLTKKTNVPKLNNSKHHVCNKCFDILTGKIVPQDSESYTPPEAYLKRIAALQQKESSGQQAKSTTTTVKPQSKHAGLAKPDREIAERLERLKEKPQLQQVTDKDLNDRLSRLKGTDASVHTAVNKPFYQPPDLRSQQQMVDDLLNEIANEVEIDSHAPDPAQDVQNRLAHLRGDELGASKDIQNNLDKNVGSPTKTFVKNIEAVPGSSTSVPGKQTKQDEEDLAEVHALMARAAKEMEIEAVQLMEGMKKDKELMKRLVEIKQRQKDKPEGNLAEEDRSLESSVDNTKEDSENEEEAAKRIMKQFLEETKLDDQVSNALAEIPQQVSKPKKKAAKSELQDDTPASQREKTTKDDDDDDDDYDDPDELPYCCICTEDARVRCLDCDMDLYCDSCFKQGHKELGLSNHRSVPYKAPKGYR